MVISQNMVIINFLFILGTFQSGIMACLTSIHCCPVAHWSVQTKQRENFNIDCCTAVRWQQGVSEIFNFLDFIICGGFRGRSFHLSNSHSCRRFTFQDSRGYLQHFFEFCSTICWQKGVSDRYTLRQLLKVPRNRNACWLLLIRSDVYTTYRLTLGYKCVSYIL